MSKKKLIIQIPCYNEEGALAVTLDALPRNVEGFSEVEWLIIDDGSTDKTIAVAKLNGVDHIVTLPQHQGLAHAFKAGLEASIRAGADIIVNTDADNQYNAEDIPRLVAPILQGDAEFVIGARPIQEIQHFSPVKKLMQRLGSWFIRWVSNTNIPDAPSGFRAMSRSAAQQLNIFSNYTYTLETIIQAGQKNMGITSVDISVNQDLRPSRLVTSMIGYMARSVVTAIRIFITYRPLRFFVSLGAICFSAGVIVGLRFMVFYFSGAGSGHIQSLILGAVLILIGFQLFVVGIVADLIAVNRKLLEKIDWKVQEIEYRTWTAEDSGIPEKQDKEL